MADALKKVVSVLLQKGGVGKTAVTANTAFEAARMGLNVLFVDSDPTGYGSELLTNEGYLDGLTLSDCMLTVANLADDGFVEDADRNRRLPRQGDGLVGTVTVVRHG